MLYKYNFLFLLSSKFISREKIMNHLRNFVILVFALAIFQNHCLGYSGGNGTEQNPFQIANPNDLQELMNDSLNWTQHFILTNDIDCTALTDPKPIGVMTKRFDGSFDGANFTISNLNLNYPKFDNIGFIGYNNGTIHNLEIINSTITGNNRTGVLCGINLGTVSNCNIKNCIIFGSIGIGGFCGVNLSYIENSTVLNSKIDGLENVGGFCGSTSNKIIHSSSDCDVNGNKNVGGFCGVNSRNIANSSSVSNIIGNENVGGFCGMNNEGDILYSYSLGEIKGLKNNVGGFCGLNYARGRWVQILEDSEYINAYTSMSKCFSSCQVEGFGDNMGGFIGQILSYMHGFHDINNCYSQSEIITNGNDVGGFIGHIDIENGGSGIDIDNCYSVGFMNVSGTVNGGFLGYKNSVSTIKINNCYWDIETSSLDSSKGGTGKSTLDMYNQSTFVSWNFDSIWYMPPNDYPKLHPFKTVSVDNDEIVVDSKFMSIYPNPTSNIFSIEYNLPKSGQIYLELYDILGNKVFNYDAGYKFAGINQENIHIGFLPTGSYTLVLKIENMIFTKKIIKID